MYGGMNRNKSDNPDSVTVCSLYKGEPDEEKVMKCIEEGERNYLSF